MLVEIYLPSRQFLHICRRMVPPEDDSNPNLEVESVIIDGDWTSVTFLRYSSKLDHQVRWNLSRVVCLHSCVRAVFGSSHALMLYKLETVILERFRNAVCFHFYTQYFTHRNGLHFLP